VFSCFTHGSHWSGSLVRPKAGIDAVAKTKISIQQGIELRLSVCTSVHNTSPCHVWLLQVSPANEKNRRILWGWHFLLSIYGSTVLLLVLGRFFSFVILYTIGRTPWTGDQPVVRPLPTQIQNKRTQTSMP
jgi:hypothetical protein